jgi:tyrosyl-tRNA synthetase
MNRNLLTDELKVLSYEDFIENNEILVSLGKKKHFLIKLKN